MNEITLTIEHYYTLSKYISTTQWQDTVYAQSEKVALDIVQPK